MTIDASTVSERKLRANRLNASKSTGPRSEAGKARSSRNAVAHGLCCKSLVLPGEDPQHFRDFHCEWLKSLNPRDGTELVLVQQIISAAWRLKRVPAAEAQAYAIQEQELRKNFLDQFTKREEELARQLAAARFAERAAIQEQLEAIKQERLNPPSYSPGQLLALMLCRRERPASLALDRLHRHEQRLSGTITRGLKQLRDLRERSEDFNPTKLTCALLSEQGDEIVQNEPTEPEDDANSVSEDELATDGTPMHTDQAEENDVVVRDRDVQSMREPRQSTMNHIHEKLKTG